jgi:hypothetical protein
MTPAQYIAHLQKAFKATHGCDSKHVETVAVREMFQGKVAWEGNVEVFELIGHPKAKRGYAWAYDVKTGSRTLAVLELPPVISPVTAVRAAIVGELRQIQGN